jgi:hypothetical protein
MIRVLMMTADARDDRELNPQDCVVWGLNYSGEYHGRRYE